ncbi:hypothetical protein IAU60_006298 [Kwoniella sp. DSM 27419]
MSVHQALTLATAFAVLSSLAQARKHQHPSTDGDNPYNAASSGDSIEWISPRPGMSFPSGEPLTVTWSTDRPMYSPAFALCTSDGSADDCGNESWPHASDNGDGTFTTTLTMPVIGQGLDSLYLSMRNDDGRVYTSPTFAVKSGTGSPNAYVASAAIGQESTSSGLAAAGEEDDGDEQDVTGSAAVSAPATSIYADTTGSSTSTPKSKTTISARTTHAAGSTGVLSSSYTSSLTPTLTQAGITAYTQPAGQPRTQAQAPLQATLPLLAPSITLTSDITPLPTLVPSAQDMRSHGPPSRPTATAIALPLALCGLILVSALVYCARSRMFRKPGLGNDEEKWQEVIKEKVAASTAAGVPVSTQSGVEVRKRQDDSYAGDLDTQVPPFGHREMQLSSDRPCSRSSGMQVSAIWQSRSSRGSVYKDGEETFTAVPELYSRRRERGKDRRDRHRCNGNHRESYCSSRDPFDDGTSHEYSRSHSSKDFYSASRRSSGGIGGVYDTYPHVRRESIGGCSCNHPSVSSRSYRRESSTRSMHPSLSPAGPPASRGHIRPSMPTQADSFGPLANPYDPAPVHNNPFAPLNTRRPLPEPIIRSSTLTSRGSSNPFDDMITRKGKMPHLTGGLQDDRHIARACRYERGSTGSNKRRERSQDSLGRGNFANGWDVELPLAGEGAYRTGDEGMGELYESLRRAMG